MIRTVTTADAPVIADIYNGYIASSTATFETEHVTVDEMTRRIGDISARFPYFVWTEQGRVLGYCYAHPWKERAAYCNTWETTIYLHESAFRRGIGRQLMQRLIAECRRLGAHALIACITAENEPSIAFHQSLGFRKVSHFREVGRKFHRWLDVDDLELIL